MAYPEPSFPVSIWNGLTLNVDRATISANVNPNAEDWERITSEVISMQNINGPLLLPTLTSSGSLTVLDKDGVTQPLQVSAIILIDATTGDLTVDLPTALSMAGKTITAKKIDSTINSMILDAGVETIDNELTLVTPVQWTSITIVSNGTGWFVL